MSQSSFYPLTVRSVTPETEQAVTVTFEVPTDLTDSFHYKAGQYLTLKFDVDGQEQRRAYSMCSAPHEDLLAVTVKRVRGGVVSNYISDNLQPGDTVEVMAPQGRFLVDVNHARRREYFLFGAGSGITPLMSILRSVLEREPQSKVHLFYGNRDENNIIFEKELERLQLRYEGQLEVEHTLSRPIKYKQGGLRGLFSRGKPQWRGATGRITIPAVQQFMQRHPALVEDRQFFICGPGQMIDDVEQALLGLGFIKQNIYTERFNSGGGGGKKATGGEVVKNAKLTARIKGKDVTVRVTDGKNILEALRDSGAEPPFSCLAGACSTCIAKVESGGVKMDVNFALDEEEVAAGFVLACQSHPTTEDVKLDFDAT